MSNALGAAEIEPTTTAPLITLDDVLDAWKQGANATTSDTRDDAKYHAEHIQEASLSPNGNFVSGRLADRWYVLSAPSGLIVFGLAEPEHLASRRKAIAAANRLELLEIHGVASGWHAPGFSALRLTDPDLAEALDGVAVELPPLTKQEERFRQINARLYRPTNPGSRFAHTAELLAHYETGDHPGLDDTHPLQREALRALARSGAVDISTNGCFAIVRPPKQAGFALCTVADGLTLESQRDNFAILASLKEANAFADLVADQLRDRSGQKIPWAADDLAPYLMKWRSPFGETLTDAVVRLRAVFDASRGLKDTAAQRELVHLQRDQPPAGFAYADQIDTGALLLVDKKFHSVHSVVDIDDQTRVMITTHSGLTFEHDRDELVATGEAKTASTHAHSREARVRRSARDLSRLDDAGSASVATDTLSPGI